MLRFRVFFVLLALLFAYPAAARADSYYIWIFSSQSFPKLPRYTHTWATWVRVGACPTSGGAPAVEAFTISWMPRTLEIYPYRLRPEPGINLDLKQTFEAVTANRERIAVWGPFAVPCEHYQAALRQKARLESGQVLYRAIDPIGNDPQISDCIHGVADTDPDVNRFEWPESLFFGFWAGRHITGQWTRSGLLQPAACDLSCIEQALGFGCYRLERKSWPGP